MIRKPLLLAFTGALALAACATTERPSGPQRPTEATFSLRPARFADLPGWQSADLAPALGAFRRACAARRLAAPDRKLSEQAPYGGVVSDWAPACAAADAVTPGAERIFFEAFFDPALVSGPGEARLTAYYEPVVFASRVPFGPFTEPLLTKPSDMVSVDLAAFAEAYDNNALRGAPRRLTGQVVGTTVRPYPKRADMSVAPDQAFAYAHPVDVYNLQVQGSGRLQFTDGTVARAAFAAQNGYRWTSALGALRQSGQLQNGATWANFKSWSDSNGPAATRQALNADPSYVFFQEEVIDDPSLGPRGAAGASLTPLGSVAVDPAFHPYGALVYVDGTYDGAAFDHLLVAQDTGGAIRRGPLRGDVFFGSGADAGAAAERMNAPARWWTLLPRGAGPVAQLSLARDVTG